MLEANVSTSPVGVIEAKLLNENADAKLNQRPVEVRELARRGISPPEKEWINGNQENGSHHKLVEKHLRRKEEEGKWESLQIS